VGALSQRALATAETGAFSRDPPTKRVSGLPRAAPRTQWWFRRDRSVDRERRDPKTSRVLERTNNRSLVGALIWLPLPRNEVQARRCRAPTIIGPSAFVESDLAIISPRSADLSAGHLALMILILCITEQDRRERDVHGRSAAAPSGVVMSSGVAEIVCCPTTRTRHGAGGPLRSIRIFAAQSSGSGTLHPTSGDSHAVTSTAGRVSFTGERALLIVRPRRPPSREPTGAADGMPWFAPSDIQHPESCMRKGGLPLCVQPAARGSSSRTALTTAHLDASCHQRSVDRLPPKTRGGCDLATRGAQILGAAELSRELPNEPSCANELGNRSHVHASRKRISNPD
jgi:hypothetical protein